MDGVSIWTPDSKSQRPRRIPTLSRYRHALPQLGSDLFLTDGGLETTLVFHDGIDLPHFASFPLLDDAAGRRALRVRLPHLSVVGGCCGTDHRHVAAIARACAGGS